MNSQHLCAIALDVPILEVRKLVLAFSEVGALHAKNFWNGVEIQELDVMVMLPGKGLQRANAERNADWIPEVRNDE